MKFILIFVAVTNAGVSINLWSHPTAITAEFDDEFSCRRAAAHTEEVFRRARIGPGDPRITWECVPKARYSTTDAPAATTGK